MTPEQLAEIRARAEAATPGPWGAVKWSALWEIRTPAVEPGVAFELDHADAEFVSHARTDIPALLDYIEELEAKARGA